MRYCPDVWTERDREQLDAHLALIHGQAAPAGPDGEPAPLTDALRWHDHLHDRPTGHVHQSLRTKGYQPKPDKSPRHGA